jgi:hypothetical protein
MAEAYRRHAAQTPNPYDNDADDVVYEMILQGLMIFREPDILQLTVLGDLDPDQRGS